MDWERDLDDFFEARDSANDETAEVEERLRREAVAFLDVAREGAKEAGAALNRHGREVHIMDGRPHAGNPSIEIHVDHDGDRELEYTIGSIRHPSEPALTPTESINGGMLPEGPNFGMTQVTDIAQEQVRDRLLAVYKATMASKG